MSRTSARENAFRLVYEYLETGERNDFTKDLLCAEETSADARFTTETYDTVLANIEFLKSVVGRYSVDFALDRIYKTDLAAMLIAVSEILFRTDVPEKVAVNEALELSHTYSTEKSASFINGILASVITHREELLGEIQGN